MAREYSQLWAELTESFPRPVSWGGPISDQGPSWPKPILGGAESWASLQGTVQALACISGQIPEPGKAGRLFDSHSHSLYLGFLVCSSAPVDF